MKSKEKTLTMSEENEIKDLLVKLQSLLPICRICLNDTLEYIDFEAVLSHVEGYEVTYLEVYKELANIIINFDSNLPSRFCLNCADDLCKAFMFSTRVKTSEKMWKRLKIQMGCGNELENEFITNHEMYENFQESATLDGSHRLTETEKGTQTLFAESENSSEIEETLHDKFIDPDVCLKCKDCGKVCTSSESYKKHCLPHKLNTRKAKTRKSIKCKQCSKRFKFYGDLEKHLLLHAIAKIQISKAGKMTYICELCCKIYQSVFAFIDHLHIHNGTKPYRCSICGVFRHTRARLKSHKYNTHGKGLELRVAAREEKTRLMKTDPLRFKTKCKYCGKLVVNEVIKRHEKMHENPEKHFQCTTCSKSFYTEQNLKFHSETHLKVRKPFKCNICGQEILRRYSLKLHMQRHASDEEKFKCDICQATLSTKGSLSEHREKHFSNNAYKCEHCDRTFVRKSLLVYHIRNHTGEKPFQCNICNKSYKMATRLKAHIRMSHTNDTYDCGNCDAKFKSYGGLANHQFVHTGYPFKCPQCDKGVANRERLKNHVFHVHKGFMTLEMFNEEYPKKTETRKVQIIKPKEIVDKLSEIISKSEL